jgi:hypothetical protein
MSASKIRLTLTALAAAAAMSATSLTGVASAAAVRHAGPVGVTAPTTATTVAMKPIHGAATGDGFATNADCEKAASSINNIRDMAGIYQSGGDTKTANQLYGQANQVMDAAENAGCFWID